MNKDEIREQMRQVLKKLSEEQRQQASLTLVSELSEILQDSPVVASFSGLSTEPDLLPLHIALPRAQLAYPLVTAAGEMNFHRVDDPKTMVIGSYGIFEPDPEIHPFVDPSRISVILCPGYAFSAKGKRLGKGGGYYDRFLDTTPHTSTIGVCFAPQILPDLPMEAHDRKVESIVKA